MSTDTKESQPLPDRTSDLITLHCATDPVMYRHGRERAITPREKTEIEEHRASCFSFPLVPVPNGWALVPSQAYNHSVACRAVDLLDQQDPVRINAEGVNVVPPAAFRADNAHAVGVNFVSSEVHRNPDLAEVAPVHASDVRPNDDAAVTTQYSWSLDEEVFRDLVSSVEEAVAAAIEYHGGELEPGRIIYVGEVIPVGAGELIDADSVIDTMAERAFDAAGESSEDYLATVTQAQKDELHALIVGWADRVEEPGFWRVGKTVKHTLTTEDLDHSCEGGGKDCGPVAHCDSEGVPLCQSYRDALHADSEGLRP